VGFVKMGEFAVWKGVLVKKLWKWKNLHQQCSFVAAGQFVDAGLAAFNCLD